MLDSHVQKTMNMREIARTCNRINFTSWNKGRLGSIILRVTTQNSLENGQITVVSELGPFKLKSG